MGATFVMSYPAADWHVTANRRSGADASAPSNPRRALREWIALADTIVHAGGRIVVVDPPEGGSGSLVYASDWGALVRRNDQPLWIAATTDGAEASHVKAFFDAAGVPVQAPPAPWAGRSDLVQVNPGRYLFVAGSKSAPGVGAQIGKELGNTFRYIDGKVTAPFTSGDEVAAMLHNRAGDGVLLVHERGMSRSIPELRTAFNPVEVIGVDADDANAGACSALSVNGTAILTPGLSTTVRSHLIRRGLQTVELELPELFAHGGGPRALVNELIGFVIGQGAPVPIYFRERIVALVDTYPESSATA